MRRRDYYNIHKKNWSTGDMCVAICAGVAIGTTVGLLLAIATLG